MKKILCLMVCLFLFITHVITANKPFSFSVSSGIDEDHPIHISKTTINYDSKSNALQITTRIFIDDFETVLGKKGYKNLNLGFEKEASNADEAVVQYIFEKLQIKSEKNQLKQEYIGKERSEDNIAIYCYFEINLNSKPAQIFISNAILHDLYDDQKNFVSYNIDNKSVDFITYENGDGFQMVRTK